MSTPTELDAALESPLIFQFHITKSKEESPLPYIRVDTAPIVRTFYDQHEQELLHILNYVPTLGLGNAYHPLDIDLLPEVVGKHYLWTREHNFKVEELDLSDTWSRELKYQLVNRLTKAPWITREWDELMAFIITGRHVVVVPLTGEDIEKDQGMPGGLKELSSRCKGREPVTPQCCEGRKHQQSL